MYIPTHGSIAINWAIVGCAIGFAIGRLVYLVQDVSTQNCLWLLAACVVTVWSLKGTLRNSAIYESTKLYHPMRRRIIRRFDQVLEKKTSAKLRCGTAALALFTEGSKLFKMRVIYHVTFDDSSNILDASQPRFVSFRIYIFTPPPAAAVIKRTMEMMVDNDDNILLDGFDDVDTMSMWSSLRAAHQLDKANLLDTDLDELAFLAQALDEWDVAEGDLPE